MNINDVIQFNETHKWSGSLGIITDIQSCDNDIRYMVCVPIPIKGQAFIFVMKSENAIEKIGVAKLIPREV